MSGAYSYNPEAWPALVTVILTGILGWYGWQRRKYTIAKPFILLCLFSFLWAVGCLLEILAIEFSDKIFWIKFQGVWQLPEATTWLWFVLEFAGFNRWLTPRTLWLMFSPSLFFFLVIITNSNHHLLWKDFLMGDHVVQVFGIANWIVIGYACVLVLIIVAILIGLAIRSPQLRLAATAMLSGMVIAFGTYIWFNINTEIFGPGERILSTMGILSLSFSLALFQFHALDPVPLARSTVIEQMDDGMLVLDAQGRIVDLNESAARIFDNPPQNLLLSPVVDFLPGYPTLTVASSGVSPTEIRTRDGTSHYFNVGLTPLKDKRDNIVGRLLLFRDISAQKEAEDQLLDQQRLVATLQERERLARELHDGVAQVLGYMGIQAQTALKLLNEGNTEKVSPILRRLVEVAKDAHADIRESILNLRPNSVGEWSFVSALTQYLRNFENNYEIRTELILRETDKLSIKPLVGAQVLRVIQEALNNSRKHGDAKNIKVTIQTNRDGKIVIHVTDDGNGFDINMLNQQSGTHLGLAFMVERMRSIGGSMAIDSKSGSGTFVKLEVPVTA
ncbi:Histidine kinase/PAS fold/Histidine kinase-, DNA gyrase B-, and HSP90-like ATPase [Dehalogenimonas alkenigignens]|uniref:Oxygen sensor histidine kinase NreB n=1 Tax=Dehalogenimonas alkenigignens TaxID=1217799 RepID=A0A0W0GIE7_9CHLR|nr:histidine kinase N-terminal 7TM domain-containing protein [Dehalogenimonas alkenigignens]KTB48316.1 Histidine kinase/PAS fold/Histidine kinase-, DNA gyrase B-, and HSP90-like ATPase [Dehalogenimonas alkenigignens]